VRGPVVDLERKRATADVDTEPLPRERRLEDPLTEIAGEEEAVGPAAGELRQQPKLGRGDVLGFVDDHVLVERHPTPADFRTEWVAGFVGLRTSGPTRSAGRTSSRSAGPTLSAAPTAVMTAPGAIIGG
jgi:hypothetical protein